MESKKYELEIGGKTLSAEFTNWTDQANGSVLVRYGNSAVLVTAVMGGKSDLDYFPLSVEYEEKYYAAGAILGSRFMRREGRPSDEAVLSARVVDRTIRPLFDQTMRRDVQIVITVLAIDEDDADVLAVNGASLALATSDIPWDGPVSAVRVGKHTTGEELLTNPTYAQRESAERELDLLACGKDGLINMIEVGASEVPEKLLETALEHAKEEHEKLQAWQQEIIADVGKTKQVIEKPAVPQEMLDAFTKHIEPKLDDAVFNHGAGKSGISALKDEWKQVVSELDVDVKKSVIDDYFEEHVDELLHREAIKNDRRPDGRALGELREIRAQAGDISEIIHGTGLFYRGGTHIFSALTLGGPGDAQLLDTIEEQGVAKRFMHHYNFPPFSVGETGRVGGFNRRMIGHGALAEKALEPVIPSKEQFPYTIRIVSETLASNGSSSMGSACAATLALMDAGVPIKRPVAGIAMGLMSSASAKATADKDGSVIDGITYKILTDIQGPEDHHGDMDFKVAGTSEGVTAVQMDVKVGGVPIAVLADAFVAAKEARLAILEVMHTAISEPRTDISPRAPKILTLTIPTEMIGLVIGPGGKTINGIKDETGAEDITIEDDGSIFITGREGTAEAAYERIAALTKVYEVGERAEGEVTRLMDFGAFVKLSPTTEGLVHISELAPFRVASVEEVVSVGERVPVIIKEIDERGRYNLSIKEADPAFAEKKGVKPASSSNNDHAAEKQQQQKESGERGTGGDAA